MARPLPLILPTVGLIQYRALDSLHLALVTHSVYYYAVKDFANPLALEIPIWYDLCPLYTIK